MGLKPKECRLPELGKRAFHRGALGMLVANLDGAVFIFVFLTWIAPSDTAGVGGNPALEVALFGGYTTLAFLLCGWVCDRTVHRAMSWVEEDRRPTDQERAATLRLPRRLSALSYLPWIGASIFYAGINALAGHTATHITTVALGTLEAGLVSVTLGFLLVERSSRPIVALALDGAAPPDRMVGGVRLRLVLTWVLGSGIPLAAIAWLPSAGHGATARFDVGPAVVVLAVYGLLVGALITISTAKGVADPLIQVRRALDAVAEGRLDVTVPVDRGGDLGLLQAGVNTMVEGLRERARLADLFGRHVGAEVAQRALEQGTGLASEQREASLLFVDIVGSTAMAEVLPPGEVVETLNAFFGAVVRVVTVEGGWVNKFEGDGALCVFGAPADEPEHATRALRAARRLREELRLVAAAHPGLDAGIGVSTGPVVAGNVGAESRYEYTVLGGPVNEASRLTDLAKSRDGRLLASAATIERARPDERGHWVGRGTVALRGRRAPTDVYEPIPVREPQPVV